jgi:alpha/beta superfamily hydrolase
MSEPATRPFPCDGSRFYVPGPAGQIETVASCKSADNKKVLAIICHPHPLHGGSMQNKVVHTLDKAFSNLGALTIRFNFRGVGQSAGEYDNAHGEVDDLRAVIAWCMQHLPGYSLCLAGFSFGAYIAMQAARQPQLQQLLTVAPPVDMFDFASLSRPDCPWLLIQGEEDEIVNHRQVLQWAQQFAGLDIVSLPATGHFFHGKLNVLQQVVADHVSC